MDSKRKGLLFFLILVVVCRIVGGLFLGNFSSQGTTVFWAREAVLFLAIPVSYLIFIARRYSVYPRSYGLQGPGLNYSFIELFGLSVLCVFVYFFINYLIAIAILKRIFPPIPSIFSFDQVISHGLLRIPVVVYLAVSAGFIEEIFFRGILREIIVGENETRRSNFTYVSISSLAYAMSHWGAQTYEILSVSITGILACCLYLKFRNLWPLIVAHVGLNLVVFW